MTTTDTTDREFTQALVPATPWLDESAADSLIQRARIASSPYASPVDWDEYAEWEATITVACDAAQYFAHAALDRELAAVHSGRRLPPPPVALDPFTEARLDAFNAAHDAETGDKP